MLSKMKQGVSDKAKVEKWLDYIGETDQATRQEVLDNCAKDKGARVYYVDRYNQDCKQGGLK